MVSRVFDRSGKQNMLGVARIEMAFTLEKGVYWLSWQKAGIHGGIRNKGMEC
jgi:hypothetical protein